MRQCSNRLTPANLPVIREVILHLDNPSQYWLSAFSLINLLCFALVTLSKQVTSCKDSQTYNSPSLSGIGRGGDIIFAHEAVMEKEEQWNCLVTEFWMNLLTNQGLQWAISPPPALSPVKEWLSQPRVRTCWVSLRLIAKQDQALLLYLNGTELSARLGNQKRGEKQSGKRSYKMFLHCSPETCI